MCLWGVQMHFIGISVSVVLSMVGAAHAVVTINVPPGTPGAINAAIADALPGSTIQLEAGVYHEGQVIDTLGKFITLKGVWSDEGHPLSILDGGGTHTVLQCKNGETTQTVLTNLLVQNGLASDGAGGGLSIVDASPQVMFIEFKNNKASINGGAIACVRSSSLIGGCTFEGNSAGPDAHIMAQPGYGGAISIWGYDGGQHDPPGVFVDDSTFNNNSVSQGLYPPGPPPDSGPGYASGGGIFVVEATVQISGCTITGGTALRGAGLAVYYSTSVVGLTDCKITHNDGDGIWVQSGAQIGIESGVIQNNAPAGISLEECAQVTGSTSSGSSANPSICGNVPDQTTGCLVCFTGEFDVQDICPSSVLGDMNGDGVLDASDLELHHAAVGICKSDVDHDGDTDVMDLLWVIDGWGGVCP